VVFPPVPCWGCSRFLTGALNPCVEYLYGLLLAQLSPHVRVKRAAPGRSVYGDHLQRLEMGLLRRPQPAGRLLATSQWATSTSWSGFSNHGANGNCCKLVTTVAGGRTAMAVALPRGGRVAFLPMPGDSPGGSVIFQKR